MAVSFTVFTCHWMILSFTVFTCHWMACQFLYVHLSLDDCQFHCVHLSLDDCQFHRVHLSLDDCQFHHAHLSLDDCQFHHAHLSLDDCQFHHAHLSLDDCQFYSVHMSVSPCSSVIRWSSVLLCSPVIGWLSISPCSPVIGWFSGNRSALWRARFVWRWTWWVRGSSTAWVATIASLKAPLQRRRCASSAACSWRGRFEPQCPWVWDVWPEDHHCQLDRTIAVICTGDQHSQDDKTVAGGLYWGPSQSSWWDDWGDNYVLQMVTGYLPTFPQLHSVFISTCNYSSKLILLPL